MLQGEALRQTKGELPVNQINAVQALNVRKRKSVKIQQFPEVSLKLLSTCNIKKQNMI